jgi:hypothetical protein
VPTRVLLPLCVTALLHASLAAPAHAEGRAVSVTRGAVHVDGELRWRGREVTSPVVWSGRGNALAFTGRDTRGRTRLVVVVVDEAIEPTAISWIVPPAAGPARAVVWLGEGRVGAGASQLQPAVVGEFSLED